MFRPQKRHHQVKYFGKTRSYKMLAQLRYQLLQHVSFLYIAHLGQECHNSKFGIFELLVQKETFADALSTVIVS